MAAGILSAPGTQHGPCENECQHKDCALTRAQATDICRFCQKPIGYDTGFYTEDGAGVHAYCLETAIEEGRA